MDIGAREIHEKQFHDAWRGYSQEEVDDFLDRVAESVDRLNRENIALHQRVKELDQTVASGRETEDMLKKTLVTAQKAAEEAIAAARSKAEQLIAEAEQRVVKANEEAKARMSSLEEEVRRKTLDADRQHATHKRDLDAQIERLRAFEMELKQRLKTFLEQQLRSLDALVSEPRAQSPQARPPQARPPDAAPTTQPQGSPQRLHATPSQPRPSDAGNEVRLPEGRDEGSGPERSEGELPEDAAASGPRRGLRGLFWGDES
jgi:cell division initiation protein